jgi:microcystin-dependent protein
MATVTAGYSWVSGEIATPAKLNSTAAPTVVVADNEVTTAKIADASVTDAKLAATLNLSSKTVTLPASISLPTGAVMAFAMNSAPAGWLACNGAAVSRSTYSALFSAVSTTYGTGDGSTTFNLPDLRGYFVRGHGTNGDGAVSGAFGAKQADVIIAHTHEYATRTSTFGAASGPNGGTFIGTSTLTTGTQSPAGGTETRPKNIAMLYCIKF